MRKVSPSACRDVAQSGSALEWGSRGRRFKSFHPDQKTETPRDLRKRRSLFCFWGSAFFSSSSAAGSAGISSGAAFSSSFGAAGAASSAAASGAAVSAGTCAFGFSMGTFASSFIAGAFSGRTAGTFSLSSFIITLLPLLGAHPEMSRYRIIILFLL